MSKYVMYYNERQDQYRNLASSWARWAETNKVTTDQKKGITLFFRSIGRRFGLISEFKEIGVI